MVKNRSWISVIVQLLEQREPTCYDPGEKSWAAALKRLGFLWRGQNNETHADIQHRMSPLTKWLTACSHTLESFHNTTPQAENHTLKHVTLEVYHCYLTPGHCQSAKNWHSHSITQCCSAPTAPCPHCAGAGKRTGGTILAGWRRGIVREGQKGGLRDDHCLRGWINCSSGHSQIAPFSLCLFPSSLSKRSTASPGQLKLS